MFTGENPVIGEIDDITGDNGDTVGYIWGARKARKGMHKVMSVT